MISVKAWSMKVWTSFRKKQNH